MCWQAGCICDDELHRLIVLQVRTHDDSSVAKYRHETTVDKVIVPLSREIEDLRTKFIDIIKLLQDVRCFICTFVPHDNADRSLVLSSAVPLQNEGHDIHAALEIEPNDSPSTARRVCGSAHVPR